MCCSRLLVLLAVHIAQVFTMPQLISFKDGKLGVNIAGFHAGVGIDGLLNGTSSGIYAEAGTPFGQSAKAGLGGSMDENGAVSGSLFAGATGRPNVQVSAGLTGGVNAERSSGSGYATAQAGKRIAFSMMAGEVAVQRLPENSQPNPNNVQPLTVKPLLGNVKIDLNNESTNEVKTWEFIKQNKDVNTESEVKSNINPAVIEQQNFRQTRFIDPHIGPDGEIAPPSIEGSKPVSQTRIDVDAEASVHTDTNAKSDVGQSYTKQVTYQKNPSFFQDIFNIPISTLKAVGTLLSNTAANTNISVQKSASVQAAETDPITVKHVPSSASSSSAHISVETPSASKLIDDIFAIPINTLGAVNKFLENNVAGRKSIQVRREGGEPTRVKLGPYARRRGHKKIVVIQEAAKKEEEAES